MANKFALNSSWWLAIILLIIHVGAMAILFFLPLAHLILLILIAICIISLVINLRRYALLVSKNAIKEFWQIKKEVWHLQSHAGQVIPANLRGDSICSARFILLNFKVTGKRRRITVLVLPDALTQDSFRQLRVLLRCRMD